MANVGFPRDYLQPRIGGTHSDILSHPNPFILQISRLLVSRGGRYAVEWTIVNNSFRTIRRYFMYSNTYQIYVFDS